ncbi:FtsW/RodA/SpoVE family cell cycle protein [Maledivibacter halophilus]|uniref:Cell division protein FtsW, lipid II flippase n=1 Tax=Maledivibacter halophilus TaxID=36842 RepID=A0A1T5LZS9_9FIRM|nr:FtsW/RodA/SpoVE family cell cycle protein [Maledivibacter halophilus]SKC81403.1 cell division protein FtsW, lipid II flippase [Maledivibacter halophilus]
MREFKDKENFLNLVCKRVKAKNLHKKIRKELNDHIEDQKEAYIVEGMDEKEALLKSIEDMGDPILIGKELNKTHKPLVEWSVLITTAIFLLISGGMQYLYSTVEPFSNSVQGEYFSGFLVYAPIGIVIFTIAYFFDYTLLKKYSWILYIAYILFMIAVFIFSPVINGAIYYGPFASLLFIPIFSGLVYNLGNMKYLGIILSGLLCIPPIIITLFIPSMSTGLVIVISCLVILTSVIKSGLFNCNTKLSLGLVYIPTILSSILVFFILIVQAPYRIKRLIPLFTQNADPKGLGYQVNIIRHIISNAKPIGTISIHKEPLEKYLPGWSSDFSFAFIIGKLGYIPAIVVGLLILFLLYRLYKISTRQNNILGKSVSLGCLSILLLQFIGSIVNNLGFYSIFTQAPPLLSYGAISFTFTMFLLGLILSVHRRSNIVNIPSPKPMFEKTLFQNDIIHFEDGKLTIDFNKGLFKK